MTKTDKIKTCPKCGKEIEYRETGFNGLTIPLPCECVIAEREKEQAEELKRGYTKTAEYLISVSGVKKRYGNITLEDLNAVSGQEKAFEKALQFAEDYKTGQTLNGFGLIGGVGSGKTYITSALVNQITKTRLERLTDDEKENAAKGKFITAPAMIISFTELFERLKPNKDEQNENLIQTVKNKKILILDDFGACKITEWIADRLFEIIDYRYCEEKPLIYTTNIAPDKLKSVIGDRVADRLKEMCKPIIVTTQSQRKPPT